jgi:hypothetical protein
MPDRMLALLSPYRPPTTFAVTLEATEAAAWLNGWAALWHPAALAQAIMPPAAASAYDHSTPSAGTLYAIPETTSPHVPDHWMAQAVAAGAHPFIATASRAETLANMLAAIGAHGEYDPGIVRELAGLGYAWLMLDTLFDAMNHDRLLDGEAFWLLVKQTAIVAADASAARPLLVEAAMLLTDAREGLIPNGVSTIEVLRLSPPDCDAEWPHACLDKSPLALIAELDTLRTVEQKSPWLMERIRHADSQSLAIAVTLPPDDTASLAPATAQMDRLRAARAGINSLVGHAPTLVVPKAGEAHPHLPGWLTALGFEGALILDRDVVPVPSYVGALVQWPGPDGRSIVAYSKSPYAAANAESFFNYAQIVYETSQRESSPTLCWQHTGPATDSYWDWRAIHDLAPVFGIIRHAPAMFADSHMAEYVPVPQADEFIHEPLTALASRGTSDPISRLARSLRARRQLDATNVLAALHRSLTAPDAQDSAAADRLSEYGRAGDPPDPSTLIPIEDYFANRLAERITARSGPGQGVIAFNTCSVTRRVGLEFPNATGPIPTSAAVKASEFESGTARVVVELPALGFAYIPAGIRGAASPKGRIITAVGMTVRNEFLEAEIDPTSGGLRAVRDTRHRVHRLGQMLHATPGSRMIASNISVTHAGAALGEITSTGTIIDTAGATRAAFTQRMRIWMGRPVLELQITLEPITAITGDPWQNHISSRFAWRDDRAVLFRNTHGSLSNTNIHKPIATEYLEVRYGKERTSIFTGGLAFARKDGSRMLDVLLQTERESARQFELMIAFDRDYPAATAQGWITPTPVVTVAKAAPPTGDTGWLSACDLPSMLLTTMAPIAPSDGRTQAVMALFQETAGYAAACDLRFARDPKSAARCDLNGVMEMPLPMNSDSIPLTASADETVAIRCEW